MGRSEAATAHGAETRERILDAARALIADRGYGGASVAAICKAAGVVRTSLYWHFGSKAGLLAAVANRFFESWNERIRAGALASTDPLERLDALLDGMRQMVMGEPAFAQLLFGVALEGKSIPPEVGATMLEKRASLQRMIVADFEDSLGLSLPDLDVVARVIVAFHHDAVLIHRFDPEGTEVDRIFDEMRRAIVLIVGHRLNEKLSESNAPRGETP
ncbi:MAG: TetR/AcrR family transcriptional regulator [Myxococcota bacterium]